MKILFDCMGGDHAPESVIEGALLAQEELNIEAYFVGNVDLIKPLIPQEFHDRIIESKSVIGNDEDPALSLRRKKDSSIVIGLKKLAEDEFDGFLSAGSTGALLAGGLFIVKRLPGIERAALPVVFPNHTTTTLLIDSGANMDTSPELLLSFGKLAATYMEEVMAIENPKIGLINVGAEKGKGDRRTQAAYELLEASDLNFIGNVEAREIFTKDVNVLISDGFVGNIMLKTAEGAFEYLVGSIMGEIHKNPPTDEVGAYLNKLLGNVKSGLNYEEIGGAPLLGIQKPVVKAHGSSNKEAIFNATKELKLMIERDVIAKIKNKGDF